MEHKKGLSECYFNIENCYFLHCFCYYEQIVNSSKVADESCRLFFDFARFSYICYYATFI